MRGQVAARRIRWGILCLPLSGLLSLQSLVVVGEYISPSEDLRGLAEQVTSARYQSSLLIDHLSASLWLVGGFALYAYLSNSRAERWALAGVVMLCVSAISPGIVIGLEFASILPAEAYLGGEQDALDGTPLLYSEEDPANFPLLPLVWILITDILFPILGTLFWGLTIWRSRTLPKGAAILWLSAPILLLFVALSPSGYLGEWTEALTQALNLGGSGWIAWSIWQRPTARTPVS